MWKKRNLGNLGKYVWSWALESLLVLIFCFWLYLQEENEDFSVSVEDFAVSIIYSQFLD